MSSKKAMTSGWQHSNPEKANIGRLVALLDFDLVLIARHQRLRRGEPPIRFREAQSASRLHDGLLEMMK
jgi:hypothetical protein